MSRARLVERRDEWNALVLALPRADFRQSWQWGAARVAHGWSVVRAAVTAGDRDVAAAQVLVRHVPGLGPVLYAPRGPLLADDDGAAALPHLVERLYAAVGGVFLRASPGVKLEDAEVPGALEAGGFVRQPDLWSIWNTPRNVMRLDLTGSEADVLSRMARKRRQHISTAARKGITTEIASDLVTLRRFHQLHRDHGRRHGYPVPTWPALEALHQDFVAGDGVAIVSGRVNGILAGMLVGIRFGPVAHTLYLAATEAAQRTPVGDLVHWELMRWARAGGCLELDLGSSCTDLPPTETHPGYGIYRFKTELGARLVLSSGYYDRVFAPLRYRVARLLEARALRLNRRLLGRLNLGVLGGREGALPEDTPLRRAS
jgi:lipid II:glycine glycyltransferase (peptidoglycan interpeptide bridge formation enzyme)